MTVGVNAVVSTTGSDMLAFTSYFVICFFGDTARLSQKLIVPGRVQAFSAGKLDLLSNPDAAATMRNWLAPGLSAETGTEAQEPRAESVWA